MRELICTVEDDPPLLAAICFSLRAEGFDARCFATANELLNASVPLDQVDCFVIDQVLPDVLGLDLLEILREGGHGSPTILITTNPGKSLQERAAALNAVIVEKPLLGNALVAAVRTLLPDTEGERI